MLSKNTRYTAPSDPRNSLKFRTENDTVEYIKPISMSKVRCVAAVQHP